MTAHSLHCLVNPFSFYSTEHELSCCNTIHWPRPEYVISLPPSPLLKLRCAGTLGCFATQSKRRSHSQSLFMDDCLLSQSCRRIRVTADGMPSRHSLSSLMHENKLFPHSFACANHECCLSIVASVISKCNSHIKLHIAQGSGAQTPLHSLVLLKLLGITSKPCQGFSYIY